MRHARLILMLLAAMCVPLGARADDSALEGVGGALRPMRGHPSVRMVSEDVRITLPQGQVEARFVFRNEGPPVDVRIGFPEQGKDVVTPPSEHLLRSRGTHLRGFRSWVDGRPVRLTRVVTQRAGDETNNEYAQWWVKRVHFARGQTRVIVDRYRGGWLMTGYGIEGFRYILRTGASWKGPIGRARITCRLPRIRHGGRWAALPRGYRVQGDRITWDLRNFEPRHDIDIQWIHSFLDIRVNGAPITGHLEENGLPYWADASQHQPRLHHGDVWVPVRKAAAWLGAAVSEPSPGAVRLTRGGNWVEFRLGSPEMKSSAGTRRLSDEVGIVDDCMMVPLGRTARQFGGKVTLLPHRGMWINLPARGGAGSHSTGHGPDPG